MNWADWFVYDETSPTSLRWKVARHGGSPHNRILVVAPGDVAGTVNVHGYGEVKLNGRQYKTHRIIYEMFIGRIPDGADIDHEDRDRLNNKPTNFRLVGDKQNAQNRVMRYDNTTSMTGVSRQEFTNPDGSSRAYWKARWQGLDDKERAKCFSVNKLGETEAFRLACEYRAAKIKQLVEDGQFYTEHHGKNKCSTQNSSQSPSL